MAQQDPNIKIHTSVDQTGLDKGLKEVDNKVKKTTDEGTAAFKGMFAALALNEVVAKGLETVKEFLTTSVEKAEASELRLKKFENTLENIGKGGQIQGLLDDAAALSSAYSVTKGEALDSIQSLELYGGLTSDQIKKLEPVIIDFAAKTGSSMEDATTQVIKGLSGQGRELKRYGIEVNASKTTTQNFTEIVENLGEKVKGSDEIFQRTSAGLDKNYKKALGGLQVTIGTELLPVIDDMKEALIKTIQTLKEGVKWLKEHKELMYALGGAIATVAASLLTYNIYLKSAAILQGAQNVLTFASIVATEGLTVALEGAGIAGAAAWASITLGLSAVVAGIIYAYKKSETFRAVLAGVGAAAKEVGGIFKGLGELVAGVFLVDPSMIKEGISTLKEAGKNMGDAYSKAYNQSLADSAKDRKKQEKQDDKESDDKEKERDLKLEAKEQKKRDSAAKRKAAADKKKETADEKAAAKKLKLEEDAEKARLKSIELQDQSLKELNDLKDKYYQTDRERVAKEYDDDIQKLNDTGIRNDKLMQDLLDKKAAALKAFDDEQERLKKEKTAKEKVSNDEIAQMELDAKRNVLDRTKKMNSDFITEDGAQHLQTLKDKYDVDILQANLTAADRKKIDLQYAADKTAIEQKTADDISALHAKQVKEDLSLAQTFTSGLTDLNNLVTDIQSSNLKKGSKEDEEAKKSAFKRNKALQIAMAVINGANAVTSTLAQYPKFDGGIAMFAALATEGIAVAASIAKIASTQYTSSGSSGGSSVTTPTAPSSPTSMTAAQTLGLGQMTTPQIQTGGLKYTKVYVTETDITGVQNKVNVIQSRATIR